MAATRAGVSANETVSSGNTKYGRSPYASAASSSTSAQVGRTVGEHLHARAEHVVLDHLERRARTEQRGTSFFGEEVVVVPPERHRRLPVLRHLIFSTLAAFSRRNFGHTWSLNGTFTMSPMIRSRVRPIGK